jgi:NAD dependent epimerase/dehydratase
MKWQGKRVLVTGAGGFIGSHLVERLVDLGAKVRAFVRYNSAGSWGWLDESPCRGELEVTLGDIADAGSVRKAAAGQEVILHLAALIGIPYSYEAPHSYLRTNVEGLMNVLEAARAEGAQRVVHTSTSEVYGTAIFTPITETHPLQGQSPYSASKIGADKMAEAYARSFATPVTILRPFNTYGPRQSARAVTPTIVSQCLSRDVVRLGNLEATRDLTYVGDTVEGFIRIAACEAAIGRAVHLGSGREISIGDLAQRIARLAGREVRIETESQRERPKASEVNRLIADNSLARELLDWSPQVSLDEGLARTIEWVRGNLHRFRTDRYGV